MNDARDTNNRSGVEQVLLGQYPGAYRLTIGLCNGAAEAVADRVLRRGVVVAPRWTTVGAAERWFLRFTVLASRQVTRGRSAGEGLAWLDPLPMQQREAVTLVHGLELDLHRAAAAMDCSTSAVANHLVAAMAQLRVAGPADEWVAALPGQLAALEPPPVVIAKQVMRAVARRKFWVWARRGLAMLGIVLAVAAGWGGWHLWQMLIF